MFKRTMMSRSLLIAFSGTAAMSGGVVFAQQAPTQELQRVEITGSSIKRLDAETALPVTIIKREDIERTGATTAQDLVNMIPSNFGGLVLANNVGSTGNPSTANLRSLGQKYTLVLLNGRRVANYAFGNSPVDLNSIPISAIERIEVLRDGASAVYGADAVAGVINFILRKDYQGLEVTLYGTKVDQGGGDTKNYNITGGFGDLATQRFNILLSVNHEEDDALKAKDRSFANTANRPDLGINKASPRNGIPNFNFTDTLGNKYAGVNPSRYKGCNEPDFALVIRDAKSCGTDYVKYIDLIPKAAHDNIVARAVFQPNDSNEIYAEAVHTRDTSTATYSPAPYTVNMTYPAAGRFYPKSFTIPKGYVVPKGTTYKLADGSILAAGTVLSADVVVTPTGGLQGTWRTVAGGGRTDNTEAENDRFLVGAKGTLLTWDYDTAITYSKNKGTVSFGPGQFSYAKLTPLVNAGDINVFGAQDAVSQAALNSALLNGPQQAATSTAVEIDLRVSKEVYQLPHGPLAIAFGASFRKEKLDQTSFPVLASGDQVGGAGPIPSVTGDRKVYGVYAEATIPLYKNLELDLAARYDDYKNGFGTSFNNLSPKASLRFQPVKEVVLRASYGEGFRAPTLYENLRPFTSGNNTNANYSDPVRCPGGVPITPPTNDALHQVGALQDECNVQLPTAFSGNKDVPPEKSKQYSLGLVIQPTANFSASIDYWDVQIKGAIQPKSEFQVLGDPNGLVNSYYRYDPKLFPNGYVDDGKQTGAIKGSTNPDFPLAYIYLPYDAAAKFFAAGIDLNLNYRQKIEGVGDFRVNYDGTYYTKHGYQYIGASAVSDNGDYQDFGPVPRYRHSLTFSYGRGPWNASLTHNYTAGYKDFVNQGSLGNVNYPADRQVAAYETLDAQIGWMGLKNLQLVAGVKNLFDRDPPSSRTEANFQTGYDAQFTNPLGRTYYLRARYKFF